MPTVAPPPQIPPQPSHQPGYRIQGCCIIATGSANSPPGQFSAVAVDGDSFDFSATEIDADADHE